MQETEDNLFRQVGDENEDNIMAPIESMCMNCRDNVNIKCRGVNVLGRDETFVCGDSPFQKGDHFIISLRTLRICE